MNLEDIARKAGVSRSTVSRVINGEAYVSEKTRVRVLAVIEAEGFTPNPAARMLVTQRTQLIGIVIPDSLQEVFATDNPYYYSTLLQGITNVARLRDYATLLWVGQPDEEEDRFYHRILKNRLMDGLIIVASLSNEDFFVSSLLKNNTPFVMIGRPIKHQDEISYVSVDNVKAARQAVRHLLSMGKRRVGTITGTPENVDSQDRLAGYIESLKVAGVTPDPKLIIEGHFGRDAGYIGMRQLLQQNPDGVFAASDMIAMGALHAIQEAGLRIPEDVAVIGFDDLPSSSQLNPALTTIRQPILQKGTQAAALLLDMIEEKIHGTSQILLPTQLVIRESCGYQGLEK